ncbi:MAG: DUF58 domain-containing protein [Defluviitaleaceae bacterium]|nr:DUF58 domain-containing protein [Defluviitaleaceae bacterium]
MPLLVLGAVVILLLLLERYVYKRLWDKGLDYSIQFSAKEAFEGDTVYLREELVNKKTLPLPWVYAKMRTPQNLAFVDANNQRITKDDNFGSLYSIMSFTATRRKTKAICQKRGVYNIGNINISVSNLLHTQRFYKEQRAKNELLVFPKIFDDFDDISLLYRHMDSVVLTNRIINPDPFEFKGIRDYQPSDPLKNINFRASAISQTLMVNIHEPTCAQRMVLVLNLDEHEADPELYEQSIRLCATLAAHYIDMEVGVGFATNGKDSGTAQAMGLPVGSSSGHLYNILESLARIGLGFKCPPMTEYVSQLTDREQMYVFVSPYHGDDFMDAFRELEERGIAGFLVVPTLRGMDAGVLESYNVAVWDAAPIKG